MNEKQGISALVTTSIIFGIFGVLAKLLGRNMSIFEVAFWVSLIQVAGFGIYIVLKNEKLTIAKKDIPSLLGLLAINTLPFFLFNIAVRLTSIGSVLIVQNTTTILIAIAYDYLIEKNEIDFKQLVLIAMALIGISSLYIPFNNVSSLGILFAVGVGITNAIANILRAKLSAHYSVSSLSFLSTTASALVWGGFLVLVTGAIHVPGVYGDTIYLLLLYGTLQIVTTAGLFIGFRSVRMTIGNLILMLEIVFGILAGVIFLHEFIQAKDLFINIMIILSIMLVRMIDIEKNMELSLS